MRDDSLVCRGRHVASKTRRCLRVLSRDRRQFLSHNSYVRRACLRTCGNTVSASDPMETIVCSERIKRLVRTLTLYCRRPISTVITDEYTVQLGIVPASVFQFQAVTGTGGGGDKEFCKREGRRCRMTRSRSNNAS